MPADANIAPDFSELTFSSQDYIYKLNGKRIPAVSTILKPLSSAFYGSIDEQALKTAAMRGTSIHECIENYIKYGFEESTVETKPYLMAFMDWWEKYDPKPIKAEYRIYHPIFRYGGTIDLVCEIDGEIIVIDFKSAVSVVEMLTRIQLEAYTKALKAHKIRADKKAILHLKPDGNYDFQPYKATDSEAWEVFGSLLTVYNYQNKYIGGK